MPMLGLSRTRTSPEEGYTLLEILFVLVLIGLVGSLVVPRVDGLYDSVALSGEREDIINSLRDLPARARHQGLGFGMGGPEVQSLLTSGSSSGWTISASEGLRYKANGFCTGGTVVLSHESGRSWRYSLAAPYCVPEELDDA